MALLAAQRDAMPSGGRGVAQSTTHMGRSCSRRPPEPAGRGIGLVGSRDGVVGEALFNQQQSALSVAVEGIYGVEQALTLDQPRLVVLIDVEHEHEILCFEVAADR